MKKLLAGGTLAVLAFGGMIATAAPASAHTPNVSADCGAVNVDLRAYQGADLTVVIDDVTIEELTFDHEWVKTYEVSRDAAHEWSVDVVAHDTNQYKNYDFQDSGTTEPCETPTPPAEVVPPAMPETVVGCAATIADVIPPANTEAITYTKTDAGIIAALTSDAYEFPTDLGSYVLQEDGTALLPNESIAIEDECETPEPSAEPSEQASVAPVDEPSESPSPAAEEEPEVLAATGATVGGAIAFAALLAAGGVALVWARRRMQNA